MVRMRCSWLALFGGFALLVLGTASPAERPTVRVAVAANFLGTLQSLRPAFEATHPFSLSFSSGSTGMLYAQVRSGAPFEILLAADEDRPAQLERDGLIVPGSRFTYAIGRLVLWRPNATIAGDQALLLPGRIAIADPALAPYGVAALDFLERSGRLEAVDDRLVRGASVSQAYQFVGSRAAAMGLVALAQVLDEPVSSRWIVPADRHVPIRQQAVLLRPTGGARALVAFLQSDEAQAAIEARGYDRGTPP
ncbi:MAG: molybdate ABC transporter substrate-binding protein [Pseudomonadota bacterium]